MKYKEYYQYGKHKFFFNVIDGIPDKEQKAKAFINSLIKHKSSDTGIKKISYYITISPSLQ